MGYTEVAEVAGEETHFVACDYCGVLVYDADKHDNFHKNQARVADMASHADMMTRPIRLSGESREQEL